MRIGHFEYEKQNNRPVKVDLELSVAKMTEATFEKLEHTVDYGRVIKTLEREFCEQSINLLESLTFKIAKVLLSEFEKLEKVFVRVEKSLMSAKLTKGAQISLESEFTRKDFL